MLVCHRCDNRRCCNPAHLFLGADADNLADMRRKGRHPLKPPQSSLGEEHHSHKLTEGDVRAIRAMAGDKTQKELAGMFGVSGPTISLIVRRKYWAHVA